MPLESEALDLFLVDAGVRIARYADPSLEASVPPAFRSAARSAARQADGGWMVAVLDTEDFDLDTAMREFRLPASFGAQCARVLDMVLATRNPELRSVLDRFAGEGVAAAAVMSAFFHYFVVHEYLHVEQGLGSDQYQDSDGYMPIVMEADHFADVAGLVLAAQAPVPELKPLDMRGRVLLLVAIHIAAMHSFSPVGATALDAYAFSRLLVWHLHFARFTKALICPDFATPVFERPWTVVLPRLVGRADQQIAKTKLASRRRRPLRANSDVVLGYQHEDGIYRIHRAAFTDGDRVFRLANAIVSADFDAVRGELEELLVNNTALIPQKRRTPVTEWAANAVIEALEAVATAASRAEPNARAGVAAARADFDRLRSAARAARVSMEAQALIERGDALLDAIEIGAEPLGRLCRQAISVVDQLALALA